MLPSPRTTAAAFAPQSPTAEPADGQQDIWKDAKSSKEDMLFQKVWRQMAGRAAQTGMTEEQAWTAYNAAGRPRGHDTTTFMQGVASPAAAAANTPVTIDQTQRAQVEKAAGIAAPEKATADQAMTLAAPDPVQGALDRLSGLAGPNQEQQDALAGLKTAGDQQLAGQNDLVAQLQEAARGGGPSAALALFQLALGKNIAGQRAAAAGVRGGSAAAASRNAGLAGEQMMRESAQGATALRAQEQQQARQLLGTTLQQTRQGSMDRAGAVADIAGQIRGQDIGAQTGVVSLMQASQLLEQRKKEAAAGTALALLQTDLGVQGQNNANELQKAGILTGQNSSQDATQLGYDQLKFQKDQAGLDRIMQLLGTALNAGGTLGGALVGGGGGSRGPATAALSRGQVYNPQSQPSAPGPIFSTQDVFGA